MKRDWNILRGLLVQLEQSDREISLRDFDDDEKALISFHVTLLIEAGLIDGKMMKLMKDVPNDFYFNRITWSGHELLALICDDVVWDKVSTVIANTTGVMSIDVIKELAIYYAVKEAKSHL